MRRCSPTGRASSTSSGCSRSQPAVVAHDLHPDYASTAYALELDGVELTGVQHHHAHLAACLAEHGARGPGGGRDLRRLGLRQRRDDLGRGGARRRSRRRSSASRRCAPVRMPGGAPRCTSRGAWPARGSQPRAGETPPLPAALAGEVDAVRWRQVARIAESRRRLAADDAAWGGSSTPWRRSAACAPSSRTRARPRSSSRPSRARRDGSAYELPLVDEGGRRVLDPRGAIRGDRRRCRGGRAGRRRRAALPRGRRRATARACAEAAQAHGLEVVVLSGGVFQNRLLLERTAELLGRAGCGRSCPSGYRRTTAASPTVRRRWRPRATAPASSECRRTSRR